MIYRYMFRGYPSTKDLKINVVEGYENASVSIYENEAFLYFESESDSVEPEKLINEGLSSFPNGKKWENMIEIFHYSKPLSKEHWERKFPKTPLFRINKLHLNKVSEYIYYHFQYQEEIPGDGDKYGIIFNIGDEVVMYLEIPVEEETENIKGMLNSKNSPRHDDWAALMDTIFKPWENGVMEWREVDLIAKK